MWAVYEASIKKVGVYAIARELLGAFCRGAVIDAHCEA